jgi:hypothetical protein
MLFALRERLALLLAPWLAPDPPTEEYDLPWVTTATTTGGAHATWRQAR